MKRVMASDKALREVDGSGIRYHKRPDGSFMMTDSDARKAVEWGCFIAPTTGVARNRHEGYRCAGCGFGSWFKTCSKCGGKCFREGEEQSVNAEVSMLTDAVKDLLGAL